MNDYDTIKAMLAKAGIIFVIEVKEFQTIIRVTEDKLHEDTNTGYGAFYTEMYFEDGNLVAMGAWE